MIATGPEANAGEPSIDAKAGGLDPQANVGDLHVKPDAGRLDIEAGDLAGAVQAVLDRNLPPSGRISIDPETVERDLARLVLTLMEFLRQLMELQAIRRMERGALTEEEEERVGTALMRASARLRELASAFGLTEADLTLDLGPLGKLV